MLSSAGVALTGLPTIVAPTSGPGTVGRHLRELLHDVDAAAANTPRRPSRSRRSCSSTRRSLQQYANMVTNTVALPQQIWGTVQSDIMRCRALSNAASLLSGNAGSIVTRLQSASGYANQAASLGNIAGQFTTWQQTIGNNLNTLGRTLGLQQSQQQNQAAILPATLQQHSQRAQGQMQAIQAGNELADANAAQLAQIQATLTADGADAGDRDGGRRRTGRRPRTPRCCISPPSSRSNVRLSPILRRVAMLTIKDDRCGGHSREPHRRNRWSHLRS